MMLLLASKLVLSGATKSYAGNQLCSTINKKQLILTQIYVKQAGT